jgi:hypothetical protein
MESVVCAPLQFVVPLGILETNYNAKYLNSLIMGFNSENAEGSTKEKNI